MTAVNVRIRSSFDARAGRDDDAHRIVQRTGPCCGSPPARRFPAHPLSSLDPAAIHRGMRKSAPMPRAAAAFCSASGGTPASIRAPSSMSPEIPAKHSIVPIFIGCSRCTAAVGSRSRRASPRAATRSSSQSDSHRSRPLRTENPRSALQPPFGAKIPDRARQPSPLRQSRSAPRSRDACTRNRSNPSARSRFLGVLHLAQRLRGHAPPIFDPRRQARRCRFVPNPQSCSCAPAARISALLSPASASGATT